MNFSFPFLLFFSDSFQWINNYLKLHIHVYALLFVLTCSTKRERKTYFTQRNRKQTLENTTEYEDEIISIFQQFFPCSNKIQASKISFGIKSKCESIDFSRLKKNSAALKMCEIRNREKIFYKIYF